MLNKQMFIRMNEWISDIYQNRHESQSSERRQFPLAIRLSCQAEACMFKLCKEMFNKKRTRKLFLTFLNPYIETYHLIYCKVIALTKSKLKTCSCSKPCTHLCILVRLQQELLFPLSTSFHLKWLIYAMFFLNFLFILVLIELRRN